MTNDDDGDQLKWRSGKLDQWSKREGPSDKSEGWYRVVRRRGINRVDDQYKSKLETDVKDGGPIGLRFNQRPREKISKDESRGCVAAEVEMQVMTEVDDGLD